MLHRCMQANFLRKHAKFRLHASKNLTVHWCNIENFVKKFFSKILPFLPDNTLTKSRTRTSIKSLWAYSQFHNHYDPQSNFRLKRFAFLGGKGVLIVTNSTLLLLTLRQLNSFFCQYFKELTIIWLKVLRKAIFRDIQHHFFIFTAFRQLADCEVCCRFFSSLGGMTKEQFHQKLSSSWMKLTQKVLFPETLPGQWPPEQPPSLFLIEPRLPEIDVWNFPIPNKVKVSNLAYIIPNILFVSYKNRTKFAA